MRALRIGESIYIIYLSTLVFVPLSFPPHPQVDGLDTLALITTLKRQGLEPMELGSLRIFVLTQPLPVSMVEKPH